MNTSSESITQEQLENFKKFYPFDQRIQALRLAEIMSHTRGITVDWSTLKPPLPVNTDGSSQPAPDSLTDCQMNIGYVVFDCICLALGAVQMRGAVSGTTIEAIFNAVAPTLSKLETIIADIAAAETASEQAWGVFNILKTIYSGGCLGAAFAAFTSSLSVWQMILYGVSGLATIVAFLATDGVAFVAEVVILLATFGFLATDTKNAMDSCSITPATAVPTEGTRLKASGDTAIYLVLEGVLRHIPNTETYGNLYADESGVQSCSDIGVYTMGEPLPDSTRLVKIDGGDGKVYLELAHIKRWITSSTVFNAWGFDWNAIQKVSADELEKIPDGENIE